MSEVKRIFLEADERGWNYTFKYVCDSCLVAAPLQIAIKNNIAQGQCCNFCDANVAASLDFLMEKHIMPAIFEQYTQEADEMYWEDDMCGSDPTNTSDFIEQLFDDTQASKCDSLIDEITDAIVISNWYPKKFGMKPDEIRLFFWRKFADVVKHTNRYFFVDSFLGKDLDNRNKTPLHFLSELKTIINKELLTFLPSNARFYRARTGSDKYNNLDELGALPYGMSQHANRMSPAGISMLYGSFDPETAKFEVGATRSNELLSLALIATKREIRVINFCKLPEDPNFFELGQMERRFLCNFLHDFVEDLSAPVLKDGREHIDYVPTQVLTEYLKSSMIIDGMIFPSAKKEGGQNLVLWGKDFVPYNKESPLKLELVSVDHY